VRQHLAGYSRFATASPFQRQAPCPHERWSV
jgi:hypothetical protein